MRLLFAGIIAVCMTSSASAERLFTPVYVKQTTAACRLLNNLRYRDQLISEQRTEALRTANTLSAFGVGDCINVNEGEWLFFDGMNGNYVCLRPRPGADCLWVRRAAVGEIVETLPSKGAGSANKGADCSALAMVVQKSVATEADIMAKWRAHNGPSNLGTDLARGILTGALNVVTGLPTSRQVDHANFCVMYFATAQEKGRRLFAYSFCPAIAGIDRQQRDRSEYNSTIKEVALSCLNK